jgi:DNA-binding transcriptional ArsR family regulator
MFEKDILNLEARRKLYNYILKNPGSHFRQISREKNIAPTTLSYHLRLLKKYGLIEEKDGNGYTRYFAAKKIGEKDKKLLNLFRQDIPRTIILTVFICPNFSQIELIKFIEKWKRHPSKIGILNKHQTTVSYYLNKLVDMGVLETYHEGNQIKYWVKEPEVILELILTYEKSIVTESTNLFIKYILNPSQEGINWALDNITNTVFDIFPHPYHP